MNLGNLNYRKWLNDLRTSDYVSLLLLPIAGRLQIHYIYRQCSLRVFLWKHLFLGQRGVGLKAVHPLRIAV